MPARDGFRTEEKRWTAVVERDRRAEDAFFYGVLTTGVYCRPGCSSRLPRRENVVFFDSAEAAGQACYRPCRRCRPDGISPYKRRAEIVACACRSLEESEEAPSLGELAAQASLSPWHFHRLFKEATGVTPKQYAAGHRAQRLAERLRTKATVTAAIYAAGFGSSSRAYEGSAGRLGMTFSAYRKGGAGVRIRHATARCYLGWVLVGATDRGLCAVEFGDDPQALSSELRKRFPAASFEDGQQDLSSALEKVNGLLDAPERGLELPLDLQGTAFQQRVWNALRNIRLGATLSYAEVAERIGQPGAGRAVANACAANRLAVAVPCHRVVRRDGTLGGYRWGTERKRAILLRESGRTAAGASDA